jgi:hypothetical protein
MLFIELEGGRSRRLHLEFHPRVSVVAGLNTKQRGDIAARLQAAITGADVGFRFNVDIAGVPQPLSPEAVIGLGLARQLPENIVVAADLPGALAFDDDIEETPWEDQQTNAPLEQARQNLAIAQRRYEEAENRIAALAGPKPMDIRDLDALKAEHERARDRVGELRSQIEAGPDYGMTPEERDKRLAKLDDLIKAIERRIDELRVQVEVASPPLAHDSSHEPPVLLARHWAQVNHALENARPKLKAPQWLVDQARHELSFSRRQVEELTIRLEAGENLEDELEAERKTMEDALAVWKEIETVEDVDVENLKSQRVELYRQAVALIGREVPAQDVESELQALDIPARRPDVEPPEVDEHVQRAQQDLAVAILDLQDVRNEQTKLLADDSVTELTEDDRAHLAQLEQALTEAEFREATLGQRLAEAEVAGGIGGKDGGIGRARRAAEIELTSAKEALEASGRKVDYFASLAVMSGSQAAVKPRRRANPKVDLANVDKGNAEMYLLSRAAGVRQLGRGESVPLIVDAAFDELPPESAFGLLNVLGEASKSVQVIYLAGSDLAESWASRQDEYVAAVVRMNVG